MSFIFCIIRPCFKGEKNRLAEICLRVIYNNGFATQTNTTDQFTSKTAKEEEARGDGHGDKHVSAKLST